METTATKQKYHTKLVTCLDTAGSSTKKTSERVRLGTVRCPNIRDPARQPGSQMQHSELAGVCCLSEVLVLHLSCSCFSIRQRVKVPLSTGFHDALAD